MDEINAAGHHKASALATLAASREDIGLQAKVLTDNGVTPDDLSKRTAAKTASVFIGEAARVLSNAQFRAESDTYVGNNIPQELKDLAAEATEVILDMEIPEDQKKSAISKLYSNVFVLRGASAGIAPEVIAKDSGIERNSVESTLFLRAIDFIQCAASDTQEMGKFSQDMAVQYQSFKTEFDTTLKTFFLDMGMPTDDEIHASMPVVDDPAQVSISANSGWIDLPTQPKVDFQSAWDRNTPGAEVNAPRQPQGDEDVALNMLLQAGMFDK